MPDNVKGIRADSSHRAAIRMKDNKLGNGIRTRIRVSARANREIAIGMKAVSKRAVATEARTAVRTFKL